MPTTSASGWIAPTAISAIWRSRGNFPSSPAVRLISRPVPASFPRDSQKAHARFELRGDVGDYARAAVRHLAPGGWFVVCFPSPQKQRALAGIAAAGLKVVRLRDVIPRETLPPLLTLFACRHPADFMGLTTVEDPLTVRHADGRLTGEMAAVRRVFGFADGEAHGGHGC